MIEAPFFDLSTAGGGLNANSGAAILAAGVRAIKRPNPVTLVRVDRETRVETAQGVLMAREGDFIAHDPLSGRVWPLKPDEVAQHYVLVDGDSHGGDLSGTDAHTEDDEHDTQLAARADELNDRLSIASANLDAMRAHADDTSAQLARVTAHRDALQHTAEQTAALASAASRPAVAALANADRAVSS